MTTSLASLVHRRTAAAPAPRPSPAQAAAWRAYLDWSKKSGWSQERLAGEVITNRAHLNQVLTGARTGGQTWRRIVKFLPMDGLLLLQQCVAWNKHAAAALARRVEAERQAKVLADMAARCRGEVSS